MASEREDRILMAVRELREAMGYGYGADQETLFLPVSAQLVDQNAPDVRRKLIEEVAEYVTAPGIDELADVLEVVAALADVDLRLGATSLSSYARLQERAMHRRMERGGFDRTTGMWAVPRGVEE